MPVDDTEDNDEWMPYISDGSVSAGLAEYPPQKSWSTLNSRYFIKVRTALGHFVDSCSELIEQLCEIMCKIIMRLYDGRPQRLRNIAFVGRMKERLNDWFASLPAEIRLDVRSLPDQCPPPGIVTTK